jgi:GNAT superfamily N-acetyltransferase
MAVTNIRSATPEDAALIHAFILGLAEYERMLDQVQATPESIREALFPADDRPVAQCVIGELDGRPAGFALFFYNFSTFVGRPGLYLEDLFVIPEHRGQGLGKALLLHLAQLAHDRGCGRMEWSVLDWNAPAIAFYESLGACRLREWQICRLTAADLVRLSDQAKA